MNKKTKQKLKSNTFSHETKKGTGIKLYYPFDSSNAH